MENRPADFEFSHYQKHYSEEGFWDKIKSLVKKAGSKIVYSALELSVFLTEENDMVTVTVRGACGYAVGNLIRKDIDTRIETAGADGTVQNACISFRKRIGAVIRVFSVGEKCIDLYTNRRPL